MLTNVVNRALFDRPAVPVNAEVDRSPDSSSVWAGSYSDNVPPANFWTISEPPNTSAGPDGATPSKLKEAVCVGKSGYQSKKSMKSACVFCGPAVDSVPPSNWM